MTFRNKCQGLIQLRLPLSCVYTYKYIYIYINIYIYIHILYIYGKIRLRLISFTQKGRKIKQSKQRLQRVDSGMNFSVVWWYGSGYFCIFCQMAAG